jgi:hypothetical protein
VIKSKPKRRRTTKVHHIRVDDVTWASLKRYAILNNVSMNYALMLLLYNAKTTKVQYLVNEKTLVNKKQNSRRLLGKN